MSAVGRGCRGHLAQRAHGEARVEVDILLVRADDAPDADFRPFFDRDDLWLSRGGVFSGDGGNTDYKRPLPTIG